MYVFEVHDAQEHYHIPLPAESVRVFHVSRELTMAIRLGENNYGKQRVGFCRLRVRQIDTTSRNSRLASASKATSIPRTQRATIAKCCHRHDEKFTVYALAKQASNRVARRILHPVGRSFF